jgi:hypothetical protein
MPDVEFEKFPAIRPPHSLSEELHLERLTVGSCSRCDVEGVLISLPARSIIGAAVLEGGPYEANKSDNDNIKQSLDHDYEVSSVFVRLAMETASRP